MSANAISEEIFSFIGEYKAENKIISQCYDGDQVMSGRINGVQNKIKSKYPNAHFLHYMAHQLNIVIKKIISKNTVASNTFHLIDSICRFFGHSSVRTSVLYEYVTKKFLILVKQDGIIIAEWSNIWKFIMKALFFHSRSLVC